MGLFLALCSILLASAAQLLLRWSLVMLPPVSDGIAFLHALLALTTGTWGLAAGLLAYAFSMFCWLLALRKMALSKAYPLLGVSYILVWCGALLLPGFHEAFHWGKLAGVLLIFCGLLLTVWPQGAKTRR